MNLKEAYVHAIHQYECCTLKFLIELHCTVSTNSIPRKARKQYFIILITSKGSQLRIFRSGEALNTSKGAFKKELLDICSSFPCFLTVWSNQANKFL